MDDSQWLDVMSAIEGWIDLSHADASDNSIGGNGGSTRGSVGGFATDSAHRLLRRVKLELAVTQSSTNVRLTKLQQQEQIHDISRKPSSPIQAPLPPRTVYGQRALWIEELTIRVIQSWFDAFHTSRPSPSSSLLALARIEEMLIELQQQQHNRNFREATMSTIIAEFWIALVDGYLRIESFTGIKNASRLLVTLTDDENFIAMTMSTPSDANSMIVIGELFDRLIQQCLTIKRSHEKAQELLDQMDKLVESGYLKEVSLSEETEKLLVESIMSADSSETTNDFNNKVTTKNEAAATLPLKRYENDEIQGMDATEEKPTLILSPFEVKAMEQRLIHAIHHHQKGENRSDIHTMIEKLSTIEVSSEIIMEIIKFYVTEDDVETASKWLIKMEPSLLVTSDIVEDVLKLWSNQEGPRIPWKAESVLQSVFDRIDNTVDTSGTKILLWSNLLMKIWSTSNDLKAPRKIFDIFMEMHSNRKVIPDLPSIRLAFEATSSNAVPGAAGVLSDVVIKEWTNFTNIEKIELAEKMLVQLVEESRLDKVERILELLSSDGIQTNENIFKLCLEVLQNSESAQLSNILMFVDFFTETSDMNNSISIYTVAIQAVLRSESKKSSGEVESLFSRALALVGSNAPSIVELEASNFIGNVVAMHTSRKQYAEAEKYLIQAEKMLLNGGGDGSEGGCRQSPIPLDCYKKLIVRKWYTAKNYPAIETSFGRLKEFAKLGYANLQPDAEIYTGFIRASAAAGKTKELEDAFKEMVENYETIKEDRMKPTTDAYNTLLLARIRGNDASKSQDAVSVLQAMESLDVYPDVKTLNLVLQSMLKTKNRPAFAEVTELIYRLQQTYNVKPDSFTRHLLLDACTVAPREKRDEALKKSLATLHEIRVNNEVGPTTYGILSRVVNMFNRRGDQGAKIAGLCFDLCCQDGWLTDQIKTRFRKSMSSRAWSEAYEQKLSQSGAEPTEWSRNTK